MPGFSKPNAKLDSWRMFNARGDRLFGSPVYRRLVNSKRCAVLLDGFYEWKQEGSGKTGYKQPYYIHCSDGPVWMAGLYDVWVSEDGEKHYTYAIVTTDSCKSLTWLHDRMPVIFTSQSQVEAWINNGKQSLESILSDTSLGRVLAPSPPTLAWHKVDRRMTAMSYNEPDASEELKDDDVTPVKGVPAITSFFKREHGNNSNSGKMHSSDAVKSEARDVKPSKLEPKLEQEHTVVESGGGSGGAVKDESVATTTITMTSSDRKRRSTGTQPQSTSTTPTPVVTVDSSGSDGDEAVMTRAAKARKTK